MLNKFLKKSYSILPRNVQQQQPRTVELVIAMKIVIVSNVSISKVTSYLFSVLPFTDCICGALCSVEVLVLSECDCWNRITQPCIQYIRTSDLGPDATRKHIKIVWLRTGLKVKLKMLWMIVPTSEIIERPGSSRMGSPNNVLPAWPSNDDVIPKLLLAKATNPYFPKGRNDDKKGHLPQRTKWRGTQPVYCM